MSIGADQYFVYSFAGKRWGSVYNIHNVDS